MTAVYPLSTDGASPTGRIAFIQSSWHKPLVDQTFAGFSAEFAKLGYPADLVDRWELPGAFEIPLHAKRLAKTGRYAAVVAAALVVDGGVYRHEFVAETVVSALMQVQLETNTPVFSVVLTRTTSTSTRRTRRSSAATCPEGRGSRQGLRGDHGKPRPHSGDRLMEAQLAPAGGLCPALPPESAHRAVGAALQPQGWRPGHDRLSGRRGPRQQPRFRARRHDLGPGRQRHGPVVRPVTGGRREPGHRQPGGGLPRLGDARPVGGGAGRSSIGWARPCASPRPR